MNENPVRPKYQVIHLAAVLTLMLGAGAASAWFGALSGMNPLLGWRLRPGPAIGATLILCLALSAKTPNNWRPTLIATVLYLLATFCELLGLSRDSWIFMGCLLVMTGFALCFLKSRGSAGKLLLFICGAYMISVFLYNGFLRTQRMNLLAPGWTS